MEDEPVGSSWYVCRALSDSQHKQREAASAPTRGCSTTTQGFRSHCISGDSERSPNGQINQQAPGLNIKVEKPSQQETTNLFPGNVTAKPAAEGTSDETQPPILQSQHRTRQTLLASSAIRAQNPVNTTRTCNKLPDVYMQTSDVVMDIERGVLARIDRKLLAVLAQNETYRMVRVPVSASKWSTWKRYCESAGISMGRAIATLIDRELVSIFGDHTGDHPAVFAEQAEEELVRRQEQVARREMDATAVEGRLQAWDARLRRWEGELEVRERRAEFAAKMSGRPREAPTKVGRNERCPCGSGLKYKHCHGLPGR